MVFIDSATKKLYLAFRTAIPLQNEWWWIGGGILPSQTAEEAAITNVKRETGMQLDPKRLILRADHDYFWKDRTQDPQDIGCHMRGITFTYEIAPDELAQINLNEEYGNGGLRGFIREELVEAGVVMAVLDLYDQVFPTAQALIFGQVIYAHEDERRKIEECNADGFSVQMFTVKVSDIPLGLHAHGKKSEVFTILEGDGEVLTCPVSPTGKQTGEIERIAVSAGSVVRIPPFVAHTFYLAPGSRMHCFSSAPFDPAAQDMIPCKFLTR